MTTYVACEENQSKFRYCVSLEQMQQVKLSQLAMKYKTSKLKTVLCLMEIFHVEFVKIVLMEGNMIAEIERCRFSDRFNYLVLFWSYHFIAFDILIPSSTIPLD